MCELFAMSCSRPATVNYSLKEFALHGGSKYSNTSGWGIAFFQDRDALTIKEVEPASDSPWVDFISQQGLSSHCVIAHVRLATVGKPKMENTHPFRRALGRRMHVFAHNGTLKNIHDKYPFAGLDEMPIGETDSELAFCILLGRLRALWGDGSDIPDLSARLNCFAEFADEMTQMGSANFLYSDGDVLFAHAHRRIYEENGGFTEPRAPGLSLRNCVACQQGPEWHVEGCQIALGDQRSTLVASVPLDETGWDPVPEGTAIALQNGQEVARIT